MTGAVTLGADRIRIETSWSPEVVRAIREIPGRRAEREPGVWSAPSEYISYVLQVAQEYGMEVTGEPEVIEKREPTVDLLRKGFKVTFDPSDKEALTEITRIIGSTWFQPTESWMVPTEQGILIGRWAKKYGARVTPQARGEIKKAEGFLARYKQSSAKTTEWDITKPLGIELYDYQKAGVEYILSAKGRCIIGDEPGVGKTHQAITTWNELDAFPAIVICPKSLKLNWKMEVERTLPGKSVEVVNGSKAEERLVWADVIILNYEILEYWVDKLPQPLSVTADESHRIKNPTINRTKAVIQLMERVPHGKGARLCLTGTPVPNRLSEISSQLEAIGRVETFGGARGLRKRWANRPVELNSRMRSTCYLRRRKKDVWEGMPARDWVDLYVEGEPGIMEEYRRAEANIVKYIGEKAQAAALASGEGTEEARGLAWRAAMRASSAEYLVAISQLKQIVARAALPSVKDWAQDFLQSGEKLGLFAWHTEIVDGLAGSLGSVKVQGGQSPKARNEAVEAFQNDPKVKTFCGQILAAGEGLTLTAASNVLLVEQPWNSAAMDQVLDRFHRRGQTDNVMGYVVLVEGTIGVEIQDLIRRKQAEVRAVVDGVRSESEPSSILPDLVVRLAERTMG